MLSGVRIAGLIGALSMFAVTARAQLVDQTQSPNPLNEGIAKSYADEVGTGRGDERTLDSSAYIIARDPFRAIRRGRQIFQRKFTRALGHGPLSGDGAGEVATNLAIGAGLSDSCAGCHGRPRGSAGAGGDVATRPDSRDAPHLFGLGLKEMLADEITTELRATEAFARATAQTSGSPVTLPLRSKGISYGSIVARPDGSVDTSRVEGVDSDLRVRPFFAQGGTTSIREFVVGALKDEMGIESVDAELAAASRGARYVTPGGMVLDGSRDVVKGPPVDNPAVDGDLDGVTNEAPTSIVDYLEFYLLNYFKPATYARTPATLVGRAAFSAMRCNSCHVQDLTIARDRRVADVETVYDPARATFNSLFATATPRLATQVDDPALPPLKRPALQPFVVRNIFTDFKRHDLGPNFYERNYDGTLRKQFLTTPLWGVGTTAPYGHDGRSVNLREVILRHGGEAQAARDAFARAPWFEQDALMAFLNSLVLFPPDDTASNLDPGDRTHPNFPQVGHGSIKLTVLFNDPTDKE